MAFITGAARGQGRSHAVRMAQEGADIIAVDICEQIETVASQLATPEDLAETVRLVEALDRRIVATKADVRDFDALSAALTEGVAQLGRLDIVSANAGRPGGGPAELMSSQQWSVRIDTALTGIWHTAKAAIPHLIAGGRGGSIAITSSAVTAKGMLNHTNYMAAKAGCVGLMHGLAAELAPHFIRVNTIHPTTVATPMVINETAFRHFRPDLEKPTIDDAREALMGTNLLPIP